MKDTPESDMQELASVVQELAAAVERLSDEVATLRQAVDDLRDETSYELRKLRDELTQSPPPYRLTSMPLDPLAEDFERRVNAVDADVFEATPETIESLLQRLMADPAAGRLTADEWEEDQEFPPGAVIEIEASIFDWFAEYPVTVLQEENWFVTDDGLGNFFLLWHWDEQCFVRLLTDGEQQACSRLTGIVPEMEPAQGDDSLSGDVESQAPNPAQQQRLW